VHLLLLEHLERRAHLAPYERGELQHIVRIERGPDRVLLPLDADRNDARVVGHKRCGLDRR